MAHEGMSMLSTEDGGDCSAARLLCNGKGRGARRESTPSASSLHVPLPLRKEAHCFCRPLRAAFMRAVLPSLSAYPLLFRKQLHTSRMALLCRMHGGAPIPAIPHAPSCSTSSPTTSASPQMTSSPPVASPAPLYSGGPSPRVARSAVAARAGVSTECWALPSVRQRRVGQLPGLSISSPLAERVSGPHCLCRPDLTHGADSSGYASLVRLQGVCCCLPPRAGRP